MSYFVILRPSEAELTAFILVIGSTCDSLLPDRHQSITWIQFNIQFINIWSYIWNHHQTQKVPEIYCLKLRYMQLMLTNLRGKTSAVGDFLEAIRHIRQNCVKTNFRLQVLHSSRPIYSDNEIPKFDVYISTNTRVVIVGIEELFLLAKTNFYLRC